MISICKPKSNGIPPRTQGSGKPSGFGVRDLMKFGKEAKGLKEVLDHKKDLKMVIYLDLYLIHVFKL